MAAMMIKMIYSEIIVARFDTQKFSQF